MAAAAPVARAAAGVGGAAAPVATGASEAAVAAAAVRPTGAAVAAGATLATSGAVAAVVAGSGHRVGPGPTRAAVSAPAAIAVATGRSAVPADPGGSARTRGAAVTSGAAGGQPLPWASRVGDQDGSVRPSIQLPDLLPSRIAALAEEPFDQFDAEDLRRIGGWLESTVARWPRRRSLRFESSPHGKRIDLRATMNASRATGWEAVRLARIRPRRRPRRVVLLCDVSRSMQPYAAIYLHLMRALVARQPGIRPEVFAFSTSLTRLTPVLAHRSAEVALDRANAKVADRYGGTFIGRSVGALLEPPHGNALRGAVVIIASDGWDSEAPEVLCHALARVRRRAQLLVWLNPRAAQSDFEPLTGSMAAALPYCDLFLPAHSLTGVQQLLRALGGDLR
ncbi:vWA domain-containing protein [Mycobacterium marinum]|uniref:vWA domain-containing protein n=1 Tax=Mycobacterium marinum TaxID=1781 RepID=UPI00356AFA3A